MVAGAFRASAPRFYGLYKSPYGPKYATQKHISGWTLKSATSLGLTLAGFGGAAGVFVVFFFSEIPRFRKDVMQKFPIIGDRFVKEIPASDNVEKAADATFIRVFGGAVKGLKPPFG